MGTARVAKGSAKVRLAAVTLAAGAFSLLGTVALAQNGSASEQSTVTVQAPRVVHRNAGTTAGGISVEQVSLSRRVSYADLNLDTAAGRVALHERIRANAWEACQQLTSLSPFALWTDDVQTCVHNAMLTWMPRVHGVPVAE
jgi:UrcA family protein